MMQNATAVVCASDCRKVVACHVPAEVLITVLCHQTAHKQCSALFIVQIKFFEVTEEELDCQRKGFANGLIPIKIEETSFSMK